MNRTINDHRPDRLEVATSITLDIEPTGRAVLYINGEHFPYYLAEQGPVIEGDPDSPFRIAWLPVILLIDQ